MGTVYATTDRVEDLWRPLTDDDQTRLAEALLEFASSMIRSKVPNVDKRITDGLLEADLVRDVVAQMVIRVLKNPGGTTSETIGPYSKSIDPQVAAGFLYVTSDELAVLGASAGGRRVGGSARIGVGGFAFPPW